MITMKRSSIEEDYTLDSGRGGVAVLERTESRTRNLAPATQEVETTEEAKLRMQRNLNRLLNYNRVVEEPEVQEIQEVKPEIKATLDEDIRPTSTTLQFGGDNGRQLLDEMNVTEEDVHEGVKATHRLSSKGKLVVVLYSLIVAVILALVIVNSGILASIDTKIASASQEGIKIEQEYNELRADIDNISGDDYVINKAETEFGMVLPNA